MAQAKKDTLKKGNASKKGDKTGHDEMMTKDNEKTMEEFIRYLYDGYKKFGHDKHVDHVYYYIIRYVTARIGECKNLKISEKAEKKLGKCENLKTLRKARREHPLETIQEHKIPVKTFFDEFKQKKENGKGFSENDAKRWLKEATLAIITKDEDDDITKKGWKKERPKDAYKQLGIVLKDVR